MTTHPLKVENLANLLLLTVIFLQEVIAEQLLTPVILFSPPLPFLPALTSLPPVQSDLPARLGRHLPHHVVVQLQAVQVHHSPVPRGGQHLVLSGRIK